MTFQGPLTDLLRSVDLRSSTSFGNDDVAGWPEDALDCLVAAGVLQSASRAGSVTCDGCGENCVERVRYIGGNDGEPPRAYVICHGAERMSRVRVPLERLLRWRVDMSALAAILAHDLGAVGGIDVCVPERLWWLGRPTIQGRRVDVFLARGATWQDPEGVFAGATRLAECTRPLVLVPSVAPPTKAFGPEARVLSLVRLLSIVDGALRLDVGAIGDAMDAVRPAAETPSSPRLTIEGAAVVYRGEHIRLGPLPLALLRLLAATPGTVVPRDRIAVTLWREDAHYYMDQIRQHAKVVNDALRKVDSRLSGVDFADTERLIESKKGTGCYLNLTRDEVSCH